MDPSNDFSYLRATAAELTEHYFLHTFVLFWTMFLSAFGFVYLFHVSTSIN